MKMPHSLLFLAFVFMGLCVLGLIAPAGLWLTATMHRGLTLSIGGLVSSVVCFVDHAIVGELERRPDAPSSSGG